MIHKILVPSGIGDFSWIWSKLVTTGDQYDIEYIGGIPDRMGAFLDLLPKDRIIRFSPNNNYFTKWNGAELICCPKGKFPVIPKAYRYSSLISGHRYFLECNSFLEAGNRLEGWLGDEIKKTDFHYKIEGVLENYQKVNKFIVNFSSYGTKKNWRYYEVEDSADIVKYIVRKTDWTPVFIGGSYDDYTEDICRKVIDDRYPAVDLVGRTSLIEAIHLLQQARIYFGACSGLMVLANIVYIPVITYYPPFDNPPGRKLSGTWHDPEVPYMGLFWEGKEKDKVLIEGFLSRIRK